MEPLAVIHLVLLHIRIEYSCRMKRNVPDAGEAAAMRDSAELSSYLAGQIGQAALDRLSGGAHPELDQHLAAVCDAVAGVLPRRKPGSAQMLSALVGYASGFLEAATSRGWWPATGADHAPDWESMRLAAVCQLVSEASQRPAHDHGGASGLCAETSPWS
jgi:hypothetical protein